MKRLLMLVMLIIAMAGCDRTPSKIDLRNPATLRDEVFSVEPRNNGYYVVWMLHDDVAGYCTKDKTIGETALKTIRSKSALVVVTYRNYNRDVDGGDYATGCVIEGARAGFVILSLEVIDGP